MKMRRLFALGALMVVACGCSDDIKVYDAPLDKQRLLGAIILDREHVWFVKLMGAAEHVAANSDDWSRFVRSIRFQKEVGEISWTAPESWKHEPGKGLRYATFRIPHGQEVTIFQFSKENNSVLDNVNRWRAQLKLPKIRGEQLAAMKPEQIDGRDAILLDLESARTDGIPANPGDEETARSRAKTGGTKPFDFTAPTEWRELPSTSLSPVAYEVKDGEAKAKFTVTPLGGEAGGLAANVNRWRGQIGLPSAPESDIQAASKPIDIDGIGSKMVELVGPPGADRQSILAVICVRGLQTWFFKLQGPSDLVAKNQANFESFVKSVRFGGGE